MLPPSAFDNDAPLPRAPRSAASTAWVLVFVDGVLLGCGSLYWLLRGRFFDETIYHALAVSGATELPATAENVAAVAVRLGGVLGVSASLLVIAVALTAYRGGAQWSWYATWALPLYCSLEIATLASYHALTPTAAVWDLVLFVVALLALIVGYRCFFPRQDEGEAPRSAPA